MNTWVSSWVPPGYCIHGMVVRHGESFTLSERLTVRRNGRDVYRPTVHYAYCPADAAIASLNELRGNDYKLHPGHPGIPPAAAAPEHHHYTGRYRRGCRGHVDDGEPGQGPLPARGPVPHEYVLKIAAPWLGKLHSAASDWTPLTHYTNAFEGKLPGIFDKKAQRRENAEEAEKVDKLYKVVGELKMENDWLKKSSIY